MIPSFQVNHLNLKPGVYVSRRDYVCGSIPITTFDLRLCQPNKEMIPPAASHTIEHLVADFLRNESKLKEYVIYFGPMGCMTGFYLILNGRWESGMVVEPLKAVFAKCKEMYTIPGNTERECGNAKFHDLEGAKWWANHYLHTLENITQEQMQYPN